MRNLGNSRHSFLTPTVVFVLLLSIFPLAFSLGMTFTNWNLLLGDAQFSGFANWQRLITDPTFIVTVKNTLSILVPGVILQYVLGLGLALLVLHIRHGKGFFRVVFLIPMMISPVAVGFIIGQMVLSETLGPVAEILKSLGVGHIGWISDPTLAPWTIILADTWQWSSFTFLFMLAGLEAIPQEPLEAAKVDGATRWQIFWEITFPLLMPVTVTVVLIRALELFKLIDLVKVITGGGPGNATQTVTLFVYDTALRRGDVSYGATIGFALLIIITISAMVYLALTRNAVERASGGGVT